MYDLEIVRVSVFFGREITGVNVEDSQEINKNSNKNLPTLKKNRSTIAVKSCICFIVVSGNFFNLVAKVKLGKINVLYLVSVVSRS